MLDAANELAVGLYADSWKDEGPAIELIDGTRFHILHPDPSVIRLEVIAHSLSKLCRFTGQCKFFYTVAEHSVMVSKIVPPELALQGLMHDASEAFIGDLSRPLKVILEQLAPGLMRGIEDGIHAAIAERFGFEFPHDPLVKEADNIALATEKRDLMPKVSEPWFNLPDPLPERIQPLGHFHAWDSFIRRYEELT